MHFLHLRRRLRGGAHPHTCRFRCRKVRGPGPTAVGYAASEEGAGCTDPFMAIGAETVRRSSATRRIVMAGSVTLRALQMLLPELDSAILPLGADEFRVVVKLHGPTDPPPT